MDHSKQLGDKLVETTGIKNVYFQPPSSEKLKYPCILYKFVDMATIKADNIHYIRIPEYDVTYVHKDPGIDMIDIMLDAFNRCTYDRRYTADNLYHDVFTIYYK